MSSSTPGKPSFSTRRGLDGRQSVAVMVAGYVLLSLLWIVLTDSLLGASHLPAMVVSILSISKGGLFIGVTAVLAWVVLNRFVRRLEARDAGFRSLIEQTNDAVWVFSPEQTLLYANAVAVQLSLPGGRGEFYALPDLLGDEVMDAVRQTLAGLGSSPIFRHSAVYPTTAGTVFLDLQLQQLPDGRIAVTGHDRSDSKRAEQAVSDLNRRLELILSASSEVGIVVCDHAGTVTLFNRGAECLLGLSGAEILHRRSLSSLVPAEHLNACANQLTAELLDPVSVSRALLVRAEKFGRDLGDWPFMHSSGKTVWLSVAVTPLPRAEGFLLVLTDVTGRRDTEDRLRKLSLAVEQSPHGILITDLQGTIEYVNDALCSNTGYGREDLIGRNARVLGAGETPSARYAEMWQALRCGSSWRGEFINRHRGGRTMIHLARVSPIRQRDGHVTHYLSIQEDISERKRITAELDAYRHHLEQLVESRTSALEAARSNAEMASRAKSAFLTNMSHEIRTPLNAILGLTHVMQQGSLLPGQGEKLTQVHDAGLRLLAIINDILDLSRIEAGRVCLEQHDFELGSLLTHVRSLVADRARMKGLSLSIDDQVQKKTLLRGDFVRLSQILLNFLSNAVKFTETGSVSLRMQSPGQTDGSLTVRFEVIDTGIGIPPEDIPRLFNAFEMGDSSTTRRFGGAGLGLVMCRKLAQLMGGDVGVDSLEGVGSTFWFTVTLEHSPRRSNRQVEELLCNRRVAIVGAAPVCQTLLGWMSRWGMAPMPVSDQEAALALAEVDDAAGQRLDLVVLYSDSSAEIASFARTFLNSPLGDRRPRLLLTCPLSASLRLAAQTAGFDEVIEGDPTPSTVQDVISALFWRDQTALKAGGGASGNRNALRLLARDHRNSRLLLAEDQPLVRDSLCALLAEAGLQPVCVDSAALAAGQIQTASFDLLLLGAALLPAAGHPLLSLLRQKRADDDLPVLLLDNGLTDRQTAAGGADGPLLWDAVIRLPVAPETFYDQLLEWLPVRMPQAAAAGAAPAGSLTDDPAAELPAFLLKLPGFDPLAGLQLLGGRVSRYLRLLARFGLAHHADPAAIRTALLAGDWEQALRFAQGLRGAAMTLGAVQLADLCTDLEKLLQETDGNRRAETGLAEALTRLDREMKTLLAALSPLTEGDAGGPAQAGSPRLSSAQERALLDSLLELVEMDDLAAVALLREEQTVLMTLLEADFVPLAGMINDFRFDQAAVLLRGRLAGIGL